jgi:hypothetical protein
MVFKVGDSIIEKNIRNAPSRSPSDIMFGVVTKVEGSRWLKVAFPTGTSYSFASHCQLYTDWLEDNGF